MTFVRRRLWVFASAVLGALCSYLLGRVYMSFTDADGFLLVPLLPVSIAFALARTPHLRPIAIGLFVGAVVEVAFFVWLFGQWASIEDF